MWAGGSEGQRVVLPRELSWVPSSTAVLSSSFRGLLCVSSSLWEFNDEATPARGICGFLDLLSRQVVGHSDMAFFDQT